MDFGPNKDTKCSTGTDHPIAHLYDVNTFQCYLSSNVQDIGVNGAINQVRYLLVDLSNFNLTLSPPNFLQL